MREMTKILLSACTVCALGQGNTARAQSNQAPDQTPSSPSSASPPTDPPSDSPPSEPSGSSPTPPGEQPSGTPAPTLPAVPDTNQPTPPSPPDGTTTTTTTTTTTSAAPPPPVTTAPSAEAPEAETNTDMFTFDWHNPQLRTGIGVSVLLGGGVAQFTNGTMRDTTSNLGGLWDLHVTIGSHLPLALDVAYVGSATHIGTLPTGNTGTLLGTAVEGTLRWNMLPHYAWTPYVFGGVGYQRYDVKGTSVSLSDAGMNSSDNLLSVPAGIGFAWRTTNGFVADIHGTYRFTWFQDLVLEGREPLQTNSSSDFIKMNNWSAGASLGYEF